MEYRYGYEEIDYVDGTQDWVWNAPQHVFFLRLRELFDEELCELYTELESLGAWSANGLINQFNEWQMQFPEELWRVDIQRKYIRTYTGSYINGKAYPEFLVERANGRKKTQRAQFEKNQEKYMSSKFGGTVASNDDIILRCSVPNTALAVTPNFDMHLTPYSYVYLNVKYNTAPPVKIRAVPNQEYAIKYTSDLADIIEIYSASCLKDVGDLSSCYLINGNFAQATKLRELVIGSDVEGYNNTNSITLGLGSNELLNKLDIQNMSGLTSSLDVSGLKNLEELYAFGSNVSGVIFADGGNISVAEVPSVNALQMKNLCYLTDEGFEATSYDKLDKLVAENSLLDLIDVINNAPNLYRVRLTGIDWRLEDTTMLERLYNLAGVTNTGVNTDQSVLSGKVYVESIKQQKLYEYNEAWPDLEISYDVMVEQFPVTFVNYDDSVLEVQYVDKGSYAVDPTTREDNPMPTPVMESSVSTEYTFAGWDTNVSALQIFSAKTVRATYTEATRSYTIRYVSMNNVELQKSTGLYGENVPYTGDIPTYTNVESEYKYYLFNRWDKSGFIDGDKTVNAIFDSFEYREGAFNGKELCDLSPVELYALSKLTEPIDKEISDFGLNIQTGDDYSFTMGYDIDYDDIESEVLVSEKIVFNGADCRDTGIKLFDEDKDFVIALDYKIYSQCDDGGVIMQCFQTNGSNGFKFSRNNTNAQFAWGSTNEVLTTIDSREMLVVRHIKGDNNLYVYSSNLNYSNHGVYVIERTSETKSDGATLVLGASKRDSGKFDNYCVGEVNWCKIWYRDLGERVCEQLVGWTHEDITLEVSGFYRYALYDDFTKESMFSLLATHLLDGKRTWNQPSATDPSNSSNSNVGGWASAWINRFLNTRFYNAIPSQMKSIIKKVSVASTAGGGSQEITSSGCYVTIPSYYDVNDKAGAPFTSEIYSDRIDFMIDNGTRKRAYRNGTYDSYWTRSPNVSYSTYSYIVNADGSMASVGYGLNGVLIEISL